MKQGILTIMVLASILLCGGCEFVAGVGTGAALEQIALQAERDLAENIVLVQEKNEELEGLLFIAETESEKMQIREAIAANENLTVKMEDALLGLKIAKQGAKTNWADPEAVGAFAAAVISAGLALAYRKRGKTAELKYDAHKAGVDAFRLTQPISEAAELTEKIGDERAKAGLSVMKVPK